MAAVADDTGLEVDALGGAPGVYSARYAGEDATYADNVAKLLRELGALGRRRRRARGPLQDGGAGRVPRRVGGLGRGRAAGTIATAGQGHQRLRLRPGLRARGRGRADVRRDAAGGEGRGVPSWAGLPGAGAPSWRAERRRPSDRSRAPQRISRPRSTAARVRYSSSGKSCRSATTWTQTWSAPASWWARTAAATVSASPHGMTASIRRSLPPPSMSSSPKPKRAQVLACSWAGRGRCWRSRGPAPRARAGSVSRTTATSGASRGPRPEDGPGAGRVLDRDEVGMGAGGAGRRQLEHAGPERGQDAPLRRHRRAPARRGHRGTPPSWNRAARSRRTATSWLAPIPSRKRSGEALLERGDARARRPRARRPRC